MNKYKPAHMMIRVEDPDKSIDFYEKAFGFHESRRKEYPDDKFDLIYLADPDETFEVELTHNYGHGPYTIGDGYGHLAIQVDDLEESWQRHKDLGYNVTELKGLPGGQKNYYFITDPDGFKIEVIR